MRDRKEQVTSVHPEKASLFLGALVRVLGLGVLSDLS